MNKEASLKRFVDAQEGDYKRALLEIKNGRKRSHWMWYIFPQVEGLGFSETSKLYGIKDMAEAREFLSHPVLGSRLLEICNELLKLNSNDAHAIFGSPDDMKLQSSMTLFNSLNTNDVFQQVLDKFYNGEKDNKTLQILERKK
ncbi:DUF1810 domain-containing protein [Segetibacter aerophilus]|uniref:Calpastatin n=1 Tax=Segetibacter aerophilus TaxID=670293 RepID=A0A512B954_9BACT|nr:DUF1810 domain-containing protein [Segetibacter aerophilus]GEO08496.1 hypothetical protein SAE01_09920 [Segetibacter aerophilus]